MTNDQLGFIGLGLMGSAMSRRLIGDGFGLRGYDIDRDRLAEFEENGGRAAGSPAEAVEGCGAAVLSLPDSDVARTVCLGENGLIDSPTRPLTVYDTTTGPPDDAVGLASALAAAGITYCDATVSGNSEIAQRGELVVMVGGPLEAYEAGVSMFESIGRSHHHVGPAGAGSRMKLLVNHILTIHRMALAEGLVVAELAGLDLGATLEVLKDSLAYSKAMDAWGERMIAGDHADPFARLRQSHKDARLIVDHGSDLGAPVDLVTVVRDTLAEGEDTGLGDLDNSSVIEVLRRRVGVGRVISP
jgi:3-hydroxyisobutyrate dehydrogenase-like beta-hydroxyacid dehydrogenase